MSKFSLVVALCAGAGFGEAPTLAQNQTWSVSGADAASIQAEVDNFRDIVSLGGGVNAPGTGPFATGRRQINWDAAGLDGFQSPGFMPGDFFNINSPRGASFATPGSGVIVSQRAPANGDDLRFGDVNPAFAKDFTVFSQTRLFAALDSTVIDTTFFLPSDPAMPATVNGFGAVFTDVDVANVTSIEFFDIDDNLLHTQAVLTADSGLSFAAAFWEDGTRIGRVRLNLGDVSLADFSGIGDAVALDDLIYGEPIAVPTPGAVGMLAIGAVTACRRRRRNG